MQYSKPDKMLTCDRIEDMEKDMNRHEMRVGGRASYI